MVDNRELCVRVLTVVLSVAQTQSEVVHVLQDLFQGQLSQFTARTAQTEDRITLTELTLQTKK